MTTLSELRKSRASIFDKITKDIDSGGNNNHRKEDTRFWSMTPDKEGNGSAVIRFLPPVKGDELPWVKTYSFGFKGTTGKWYINESPSTIGLPDPVSDRNSADWATNDPAIQEEVRKRKRRTQYISNIVVLKDPANPENVGKTFLWKYGKKIHDMIVKKAKPEFEDDKQVLVYDIWEGANFKLRMKKVAGYTNYDSSEFDAISELFSGDEDKQQAALDGCHRLAEFVDPGRFKSYDVLKTEFEKVMNGSVVAPAASRNTSMDDSDDSPSVDTKPAAAAPRKIEPVKKQAPAATGEDDEMEYFRKLMESDE